MNKIFSDRIADVPKSFIREILKVAINKEVISFAGGLPNRDLFPVEDLQKAADKVFKIYGSDSLQYSNSEGLIELREYIANRYKTMHGINVNTNNILITNGSQQGLDLLAKIFVNEKDDVIIEEPGYLGAIQAFSVFRAKFHPVKLNNDGLDLDELEYALKYSDPKLMYCVPNFQNPSG
ncbi:aminotransferase class I/II-fold pyridoxal phosphate-dependent enzyme, partial [Bacteroidota bacterium]